jgi:hypothetical protein
MPDGLNSPFERKAFLASELDRIKDETRCGKLISSIELEECTANLFKSAVRFLDSLPDLIERDCGVLSALVVAVDDEIDVFREEVYRVLAPPLAPAERIEDQIGTPDTRPAADD